MSSVAGPSRWRGTTASSRGSPSGRSPIVWAARRRRSRRTSTTHLTLTKGLRKPRRDARRVWRPPAHKADPGLSRAERTPPWRGGASLTPDPVRRSSARQGALLECVREPAVGWQQPPVVRSAQLGDRGRSRPRGRRDYRNRGIAAARFERARQRKHSRRAESPILGSGWKRSRDVASPYCCSDEPARGPSACSRPGGGRLSKRITLVWAQSLRLAKHQRGSGSPASMASDSWIAASMRQSDAEIDTIAARPRQEPARGPVGLAQSQGERHSPRDRGRGCRDCSQAAAEGSLLLLDRRGSG